MWGVRRNWQKVGFAGVMEWFFEPSQCTTHGERAVKVLSWIVLGAPVLAIMLLICAIGMPVVWACEHWNEL